MHGVKMKDNLNVSNLLRIYETEISKNVKNKKKLYDFEINKMQYIEDKKIEQTHQTIGKTIERKSRNV